MEAINPQEPYAAVELQAAVGMALSMRDAASSQAITLAIEVERQRLLVAAREEQIDRLQSEIERLRAELEDLGWSDSCRDTGTAPTAAS